MRGSRLQGRFDIDGYESLSIYEGITEDLGYMVGVQVDWFEWDSEYFKNHYTEVVDDIYDVSASFVGGGRRWKEPIKVETVTAQFITGRNVMNTRGFYTTDTLRLTINIDELEKKFPGFLKTRDPSDSIRDRIIFKGEVFHPTQVMPRGHFAQRWAVVTIDCNQVKEEELVNEPQFQDLALMPHEDARLDTYGAGTYDSGAFGD